MKKLIALSLVLTLFTQVTLLAQEDNKDSIPQNSESKKHPVLTDRFLANIGVYFPSKRLKIGADGSLPNDEIDFDESFDFDKNETTFAANFIWRFSKKWNVGVEYFGIKSVNSLSIDEEIEWEDVTYPVGVNVEAAVKLNMYRIFFGRVISRGQKHELGGGLGVHMMDIVTTLEGEAFIGDNIDTSVERRSVDVIAPLPNIGFWYFWTPSERWALSARIDWFGIEINDIKATLWNIAPGVSYQITRHFDVGLNYRYFQTKIDISSDNWSGNATLGFSGPLLTVGASF